MNTEYVSAIRQHLYLSVVSSLVGDPYPLSYHSNDQNGAWFPKHKHVSHYSDLQTYAGLCETSTCAMLEDEMPAPHTKVSQDPESN